MAAPTCGTLGPPGSDRAAPGVAGTTNTSPPTKAAVTAATTARRPEPPRGRIVAPFRLHNRTGCPRPAAGAGYGTLMLVLLFGGWVGVGWTLVTPVWLPVPPWLVPPLPVPVPLGLPAPVPVPLSAPVVLV